MGAALLVVMCITGWWWVRRRRTHTAAQYFDQVLAQAATPMAQVAAMSELLRRAARVIEPQADRLLGEDWLRFLDQGMPTPVFVQGVGALLADGAYRRDVDAGAVAALRRVARQRFLSWMSRT